MRLPAISPQFQQSCSLSIVPLRFYSLPQEFYASQLSILKASYHLQCQGKPVPQAHTMNALLAGFNLQMRSKNKIVDVTDMRNLTKLIPGSIFCEPKPPQFSMAATLARALGQQASTVSITCAVRPIAFLALCDFGRVCKFGSFPLQGLLKNTHPARLQLTTTSFHAAHA